VPEYFTRYGFTKNPFMRRMPNVAHDGELTEQASTLGLLLDIDGFKQLSALDSYLTQRVDEQQPAFVLISGPKESGLSSAALAVMLHYRRIRKILGAQLAPVVVEMEDHDPVRLFKTWAAALYPRVFPKLPLLDPVKQALYDARKLTDADTLKFDLQGVVSGLEPAMKSDTAAVRAIASAFEVLKTPKPIDVAMTAFEQIETVCVFTVHAGTFDLDDAIGDRPVHLIQLGFLTAEEVERIVATRWGTASPLPFHADTFSKFCEKLERPVGAVLTTAEDVLKSRVGIYEKLKGSGQWPADAKLGLSDIETLTALEILMYGGTPKHLS
jgi:hypothetical protein